MPLHTENPLISVLDGFDDAVRGLRCGEQSDAEILDGLMMTGTDLCAAGTQCRGEQRVRCNQYVVVDHAGLVGMHLVDGIRSEVLVQSPAERDIDYLQTAANPHYWELRGGRAPNQRNLRLVDTFIHSIARRRHWVLSVEGWMNISASENQQTVETVETCCRFCLSRNSGSDVEELEVRPLSMQFVAYVAGVLSQGFGQPCVISRTAERTADKNAGSYGCPSCLDIGRRFGHYYLIVSEGNKL